MWLPDKSWFMDLAEVIDALRVFPRFLVTAYAYLVGYTTVLQMWWYFNLPAEQRTVEVTAFFTMLMGGLLGLSAYIFKVYTDGGYDWEKYHARSFDSRLPVRASPNPPG